MKLSHNYNKYKIRKKIAFIKAMSCLYNNYKVYKFNMKTYKNSLIENIRNNIRNKYFYLKLKIIIHLVNKITDTN